MGDVLPIAKQQNPLSEIRCRFIERKWMRAARAWRCSISLPENPMLPSMLTGLIDQKVRVEIKGEVDVTISPALVVDVPSKGKRFSLLIETCYEQQNAIGPYLTALTDTMVTITIGKHAEQHQPKPQAEQRDNNDPLRPDEIKGLHVGFFRNERFWAYLEATTTAASICSEAEAKAAFKSHMGVDSCKDIPRAKFAALVASFNLWLRG